MGHTALVSFSPWFLCVIAGNFGRLKHLTTHAWQNIHKAFRPSTISSHHGHFKTFILFTQYFGVPFSFELPIVLASIQYLHSNSLIPKVIQGYISSLRTMTYRFGLEHSSLSHHAVFLLLRSLRLNSHTPPPNRGVFSAKQLADISKACEHTRDPILFRAAFLTAFFGFLCMSNIAPHSLANFDSHKHILRQDLIFRSPGVHIKLK